MLNRVLSILLRIIIFFSTSAIVFMYRELTRDLLEWMVEGGFEDLTKLRNQVECLLKFVFLTCPLNLK